MPTANDKQCRQWHSLTRDASTVYLLNCKSHSVDVNFLMAHCRCTSLYCKVIAESDRDIYCRFLEGNVQMCISCLLKCGKVCSNVKLLLNVENVMALTHNV